MTEVIGTEGKLAINANPVGTLVEMHEAAGVRRQIPGDYYGRFEHAFVTEANEFTASCLDNTRLPFKLSGAVQAVKIGCALQESLNSGQKINFDETGRRIETAKLFFGQGVMMKAAPMDGYRIMMSRSAAKEMLAY
ncbi:hypothetical protein NM208_g17199 [Fusarium decemcellulare]|uniref:Uncharacterized protein n=1 Tax=Fusarium decemcellulare TaxID=57161 RepID=A0ACC1R9T0_9HYPO|nr:hypothetical protein NM208_g17199 [Fusarium decemcellulare]